MTDSKKALWKANLLEFFHNYFIGISNLECTEEECPIVDNWDEIENKNSRKGLSALYKITPGNYLVVDAKVGNTNDLGTWEDIEITLPSKTVRKVKPKEIRGESKENPKVLESGYNPKKIKEEPYLKDDEFALFFNNPSRSPNLDGVEDYLDEMWEIKQDIIWDRDNSRKKIINWVEQKPDPLDKSKKVEQSKNDYIFYIHNPDITNEIKKYEVFQTQNTKEREQLHADYEKLFSEIRRIFGIRHLTSKKEERQNNPEIELNEAQFIALERRKKRIREKCLKEAVAKGFCKGEHILSYGTAPEQREEKLQELEEIKELERSTEALPSKDLEEEPNQEPTKEGVNE